MSKFLFHIALYKSRKNGFLRKRSILLFFILSLLGYAKGISQINNKTASFNYLDKTKADSLFKASDLFIQTEKFYEAIEILEKANEIFQHNEDYKASGNSLNKIAYIYYYQGKYLLALDYYKRSIIPYKKVKFNSGLVSSINNMGAINYSLGNYAKALDYYNQAVQLNEILNNKSQKAATTQNIGGIYYELKKYDIAIKHFSLAHDYYSKVSDMESLSQILNSIGSVYLEKRDYNKALEYFENALKLAQKTENKQRLLSTLYNLGELNILLEKFEKSIDYYSQSLNISREVKNHLYESNNLISLGIIDQKLGRKVSAIKKCEKGLEIAKKVNSVSGQEEACKCLYDAYKSLNISSKALKYNEQMYVLRDSLNLKQTSDKIINMEFEKEMLLDSIMHIEKERKAEVAHQQIVKNKEKQRNIFIIAGCFALLLAFGIFSRLNFVKKSKARLQIEKDRSEHLLLNILPEEIAEELKEKGFVNTQDFDTATILFTDFKSFTETASQLTPQELVEEINVCFKAFDHIMDTYNIEKIKTIGDAYMAAGGLPKPDAKAVKNTILAALDMQAFVGKRKRENDLRNKPAFEMRAGIHVGPIIAGIVGVKKFQYDIWGDTVNTASRMESNSLVGKVNISQNTYLLVKDEKDLAFEYRGKVSAKGKGELEMYFVSLKA